MHVLLCSKPDAKCPRTQHFSILYCIQDNYVEGNQYILYENEAAYLHDQFGRRITH